ncbi:MAG: DUF4180 domain-containing protein [Candidatus Acidiferrales bacterium]
MSDTHELHGVRVFELAAEGPQIRTTRDATYVVSEAFAQSVPWLAIPVARLDDDFFRLRTGVAGEVVSKFVAYGMRTAFICDISQCVAGGDSFRDFVLEANRGKDFWFVTSLDELSQRLVRAQSRSAIPQVRR